MSVLQALMQRNQMARDNEAAAKRNIFQHINAQRMKKLGRVFMESGDFSPQGLMRFAQENGMDDVQMQNLVGMVVQFKKLEKLNTPEKTAYSPRELYSVEDGRITKTAKVYSQAEEDAARGRGYTHEKPTQVEPGKYTPANFYEVLEDGSRVNYKSRSKAEENLFETRGFKRGDLTPGHAETFGPREYFKDEDGRRLARTIRTKADADKAEAEGWAWGKAEDLESGDGDAGKRADELKTDFFKQISQYNSAARGENILSEAMGEKGIRIAKESFSRALVIGRQFKQAGGDVAELGLTEAAIRGAVVAEVIDQQTAEAALNNLFGATLKLTDPVQAKKYLDAAGGDKEKAREIARQHGWVL